MTEARIQDPWQLAAALILCLVFGSIHAYGVLLIPIEGWLSTSRIVGSLAYSLAIVALTVGVPVCAVLSRRLHPAAIALICGSLAFFGLGLAALGGRTITLLAGYGLAFGLGNGIAYSLSLKEVARSSPAASAWAMGLATALYGLGSVIAALLFGLLLKVTSVQVLLLGMGLLIAAVCAVVSLFLYQRAVEYADAALVISRRSLSIGIVGLWAIYLLGATGCLMIIAHSAGFMATFPQFEISSSAAPMLVGIGSIAGSYLGGIMASHFSPRLCLGSSLFGLAAALAGLLLPFPELVLLLLMGCGLCYGTLISVVPAIVRQSHGNERFAGVFGLVFTAWGMAGVFGPLLGGWAYDWTKSYSAATLIASILSAMAGVLALLLFSSSQVGPRGYLR